jgi:hypothetical protein
LISGFCPSGQVPFPGVDLYTLGQIWIGQVINLSKHAWSAPSMTKLSQPILFCNGFRIFFTPLLHRPVLYFFSSDRLSQPKSWLKIHRKERKSKDGDWKSDENDHRGMS